jgi:hypothetical protein
MLTQFLGRYAKTIAAALGGAVSVLQHYYGGQPWFAAVIIALTTLGVSTVPNSPKPNGAQ